MVRTVQKPSPSGEGGAKRRKRSFSSDGCEVWIWLLQTTAGSRAIGAYTAYRSVEHCSPLRVLRASRALWRAMLAATGMAGGATPPLLRCKNNLYTRSDAGRTTSSDLAALGHRSGGLPARSTGACRPVLAENSPLDCFPGARTTENSPLNCFPGARTP